MVYKTTSSLKSVVHAALVMQTQRIRKRTTPMLTGKMMKTYNLNIVSSTPSMRCFQQIIIVLQKLHWIHSKIVKRKTSFSLIGKLRLMKDLDKIIDREWVRVYLHLEITMQRVVSLQWYVYSFCKWSLNRFICSVFEWVLHSHCILLKQKRYIW